MAWLIAGSLLLANACSGDSSVSFDDTSSANGGGGASGGGSKTTSGGSAAGAEPSAGASAQSGSAGKGNGGNTSAGSNAAGTASTAGTGAGGKGNSGSSNGGSAGKGGMTGNAGKGGGGVAGMSGNAGSGGADECTTASYGNHDYSFCGIVDSAVLAAAKCQSLGMGMVSIESQEENAFVLGKQQGSSWLGGTDQLAEGTWLWASTGTVFWAGGSPESGGKAVDGVYQNFIALQPNDNGADGAHENCIVLTASGWNDILCTIAGFRAACEETP